MNSITIPKKSIKIGKDPIVIMPLKKWQEAEETIEDLEDKVRFLAPYNESKNQKRITLEKLKKKYNL